MKKELLEGLTKEQIEKASKCKDSKELLELAKEEGVELTDEQLNAISGGCSDPAPKVAKCPQCGAEVTAEYIETTPGDGKYQYQCLACGYSWFTK